MFVVLWKDTESSNYATPQVYPEDDLPIHYAQQTIHISKIQDNVVTLDSPLFFKASVLTLFQVHVVLDDANRAQQCWDFWNTYWKRDQHEDNEQILQDAQVIVQALPTWEEFPGTQIQAYDFRKALLGTKKRSMRGSCKFSVCELLALPAEYLELLCTILRQIELGQPWPKQWCQAFVVLLPKPDADSTSPIRIEAYYNSFSCLSHVGTDPYAANLEMGISFSLLH